MRRGFSLDRATHAYTLNGVSVPSVTDVINAAGNYGWFSARSAWRGSVIHALCEIYDEDNPGNKKLPDMEEWADAFLDHDPKYYPSEEHLLHASGWVRFRREILLGKFQAIEKPLLHNRNGFCYAGTPDRVTLAVILDIKSGEVTKEARLQLAAYSELAGSVFQRIAVQLSPDGGYTVREFPVTERREDLDVFHEVLNLYNWRQKRK